MDFAEYDDLRISSQLTDEMQTISGLPGLPITIPAVGIVSETGWLKTTALLCLGHTIQGVAAGAV
jgi:hypothetical protein